MRFSKTVRAEPSASAALGGVSKRDWKELE